MAKGCVGCGIGLAYKAVDNLCSTCLKARELYESGTIPPLKPMLKVFQVTLYKQRKFSELVENIVVLLASDEDTAARHAFVELGIFPDTMARDHNYHVWEIDGPFSEGSILYRTPQ